MPTQYPPPRFKTSPRGVRLFVGNPGPARRASSTDEKKGKSGSIQSAHGTDAGALAAGCADARDTARTSASQRALPGQPRQDLISVIL